REPTGPRRQRFPTFPPVDTRPVAGPGPSCARVRPSPTVARLRGPAMKSTFSQRVARLARSLWRRPAPRAAAPPPFRPALDGLEDRALPSTLTVLNLNDAGAGSLREELARAQDGDTVVFAPRLRGTITLTSGELQVGKDVTIQGPGAGRLAVSGNHDSRVF